MPSGCIIYIRNITYCSSVCISIWMHLSPNITSIKRFAASGYKQYTACNTLLHCISKQPLLQSFNNKYLSRFSLASNNCLPSSDSLNHYALQFTNSDICPEDCLNHKRETIVFILFSSLNKCYIFRFTEFFFLGAICLLLHLKLFNTQIVPADKSQKSVKCCNHIICTANGILMF